MTITIMHIRSSRYQDVANDVANDDDYKKDKNSKRTISIIMRSSSTSSTLVSCPSRILMLLLVGLYSVVIASAFRPSLSSSPSSSSHLHLHRHNRQHSHVHSYFSRPTSSSQTSSSLPFVVMEPVPGKFNNLRKQLISRTRRGFRNDVGDAGYYTGYTFGEIEIGEGETENKNEEPVILNKNININVKNMNKSRYSSHIASSSLKLRKKKKQQSPHVVETVEELRRAILDQQLSLSDTSIVEPKKTPPSVQLLDDDNYDTDDDDCTGAVTTEEEEEEEEVSSSSPPLMDHAVRNLIKERYLKGSTPGNRLASDNSTLALAIEGGGMRGCVSAGMVAAITALGLSDSIDTIYGSSAGSLVGAYMVSRQVCLDIYVDIMPASKQLFVSKKRMVANLASLSLGRMLTRRSNNNNNNSNNSNSNNKNDENRASLSSIRERLSKTQPGMNISFVLDGIMGNDHGLRPLDIDAFQQNDMKQKLRVVSSCVDPHTGKLFSKCFGSDDFFHDEHAMVNVDCQRREGLFACLEASMTVPVSYITCF